MNQGHWVILKLVPIVVSICRRLSSHIMPWSCLLLLPQSLTTTTPCLSISAIFPRQTTSLPHPLLYHEQLALVEAEEKQGFQTQIMAGVDLVEVKEGCVNLPMKPTTSSHTPHKVQQPPYYPSDIETQPGMGILCSVGIQYSSSGWNNIIHLWSHLAVI